VRVLRGAQTRTTIAAKTGTEKVRAAYLLKGDFHTSAPNRAWVTSLAKGDPDSSTSHSRAPPGEGRCW